MKRLVRMLCAVVIGITALIGLSCVASADDFSGNIVVDVTASPKGTILNGFYNKDGTAFQDTKTRQTTEDIVRASLMQDFIPVIEEYINKNTSDFANKKDYSLAESPFPSKAASVYGNTSYTCSYLPATKWGEVLTVLLNMTSGDSGAFYNELKELGGITSAPGNQIYINFSDAGTIYSLLVEDSSTRNNCQEVVDGLYLALLKSVVKYTYCIYEYDGSMELRPISDIDTAKMHLAYIVHPFVGIIPCTIDGYEISNFEDYVDIFGFNKPLCEEYNLYSLHLTDTYVSKHSSDKTRFPGTFWWYLDRAASETARNTWAKTPYTCTFLGTTTMDSSQRGKRGIFIHPDYLIFFLQTVSADPEYTAGLTSIADKSGLANTFVARKNAKQEPVCYVNSMYPLGYIEEWNFTDVYGIFKDLFSSKEDKNVATVSSLYYFNGLAYSNNTTEGLKYRYSYLRGANTKATFSITGNSGVRNYTSAGNFYFYDVVSGCVYENITSEPKAISRTDGEANDTDKTFVSAQAGILLNRYKKTNIVLNSSSLQQIYIAIEPPTADYYRGVSDIQYTIDSDAMSLLIIPSIYMECIDITSSETVNDPVSWADVVTTNYQLIGTGRKVIFDLTKTDTMNLLETDGTVKFAESGEPTAGVYYNTGGRLLTSDKKNIKMEIRMLADGPAIVLSEAYLEQSNILSWLETSQAGTYLSGNAKITGFTADKLYQHLISKGIALGGTITANDDERLDEIRDELAHSKQGDIVGTVCKILSFVGILVMVYACLLVICFYIDIFNTMMNFSLLNLITFGGYKAIAKKSDLEDLGITDPKEQKRYVDRFSIIGLWALAMGLGLLLFGSNQMFVWAAMLYNWLTSLFGI